MINNYQQPKDFLIPNNVWWIIYEEDTKQIISYIQSPAERGCVSSPHILITTSTKEELQQYIIDNNLILPPELNDNYYPTYNID